MLKYPKLFLGSLIAIFAMTFPVMAQCSKTMAWSNDYPYSFKAAPSDISPSGININIAQAVFWPLKCTLRFTQMPFARALVELKLGRIDIIGGAFSFPDRHEFAWYSNIELGSPNVLFMHNDDHTQFSLNNLADIQTYQLKLGAQIGVAYSEEYVKLSKKPEFAALISLNNERKALWKMLHRRRIDAVIADLHTGLAELKQLGLEEIITPSQLVVSTEPAYYMFSKKTTEQSFVESFDTELIRLKNDGTLDAILQRYR
ncbi:substrate-binding periplasmic protein [Pseudoalteromonas mariniglutinosa]|uniref:substrate-binding periplasmic protein n=1 Tax=Pseudoalteromonas mariniglutinosa TaxID=206042 RepID=UPI00384C79EF